MITWKKVPSNPRFHDQWSAVEITAVIRKVGDNVHPEYEAVYQTRYLGQRASLAGAKTLVSDYHDRQLNRETIEQ